MMNGDLSDLDCTSDEDEDEESQYQSARTVTSQQVDVAENTTTGTHPDTMNSSSGDNSDEEDAAPSKPTKRVPVCEKWKVKQFEVPAHDLWHGTPYQDSGENSCTPYEYFKQYIPDDLYETSAFKTNNYSIRTTGSSISTDSLEIRKLIAMHIVIGILKFPRLRLF